MKQVYTRYSPSIPSPIGLPRSKLCAVRRSPEVLRAYLYGEADGVDPATTL